MSESFYRINCWLHNRKGESFAVELRDANGRFYGIRQDESDSSITSIREGGKIDRSAPFKEFSVPTEVVMSLLANLDLSALPAIPKMTGGFDGAIYHVQIMNGESMSHFSWWLQCPEPWTPIKTFWEQVIELSRT